MIEKKEEGKKVCMIIIAINMYMTQIQPDGHPCHTMSYSMTVMVKTVVFLYSF